jgi:hypothetical protein
MAILYFRPQKLLIWTQGPNLVYGDDISNLKGFWGFYQDPNVGVQFALASTSQCGAHNPYWPIKISAYPTCKLQLLITLNLSQGIKAQSAHFLKMFVFIVFGSVLMTQHPHGVQLIRTLSCGCGHKTL